jgi:Fic family protein
MGPEAFQPLFPEEHRVGRLVEKASELVTESHRLAALAGGPIAEALAPWLRAMNSYYTNRIEGQHTKPSDIERALRQEFDADKALARKQRLALAHMQAETILEQETQASAPHELFVPHWVLRPHECLYGELPEVDRFTEEGEPIVPGELRRRDVDVGRHVAPPWEAVPALVSAWCERYGTLKGREALLVGLACSHHRLAWVHPFIDGNGRAARLHSHLVLHAMGLTQGLWSPMRGIARTQEKYYARLSNADLPRRNDLDGRGPLSQEELVAFATYFLDVCIDQAVFMRERLRLDAFRDRLRDVLAWAAANPWRMGSESSLVKMEALEALHYVSIAGPLDRSRFIAMTGLGERTGRRVLASLLGYGLLSSPTTRAPVTFAIPFASLRFLFPGLWSEAESDAEGS